MWALALLAAAAGLAGGEGATGPKVAFKHIAFGTPLDVTPRPGEPVTEAVRRFHETGENLYTGDRMAIAEGKRHYEEWCQSCHMPDGSGRIGPSLVGETHVYASTTTDVGLFEAIYGGALGAMQPFRDRLAQDEILKLIAYVRDLRR